MDVRLSPEHEALRDSVAQVVDRLGPRAVGQLDDTERASKLEAAVAAAGWRELRAPAEDLPDGTQRLPNPLGALATGVEVAIVAEELGRGLADAPFLGPTLAAELRRLAGAPMAASAETVAFAPRLGELACVAEGASPAGRIAVDCRGATTALVLMPAPDGHVLGEVALEPIDDASTEGQVDLTRATATVSASPPKPLADQRRTITDDDLDRWQALALTVTSADLVGVMRGAVQLSCDYASERRQYGSAIGSFQAIQHLLADAFVAAEGSYSVGLHAAWAVDALPPAEALAAGAAAKAYSARAARTVCETAIQVHGGIGNTWECLAHVFLRRALLSSDALGGVGPNLERVLAHHGVGGDDGLR